MSSASERLPAAEAAALGDALCELVVTALKWAPRNLSLTAVWTLAELGENGPCRVTGLAATQGVTQPTMTVLVRTLEKAGLVERGTDPADKRVSLIRLTDDGRRFVEERRREGAGVFARLIDALPADQAAPLVEALPALLRLRELTQGPDNPLGLPSGGAVAKGMLY